MQSKESFEAVLGTCGGRIVCHRCQAFSKRTRKQCRSPAMTGKTKCRFHGGKSTGPKTLEGKQRAIQARINTGLQTKTLRQQYQKENAELARLEERLHRLGMKAPKTPGPKPLGFRKDRMKSPN